MIFFRTNLFICSMAIIINNSAFDHDDYSNDEMDSQQHIRHIVSTIADSVVFAHLIIGAFGICANSYVIIRVVRLARNDPDKYKNGTGIGLLSMSIADVLSLLSITIHYVLGMAPINASKMVKTYVCKVSTCFYFYFLISTG